MQMINVLLHGVGNVGRMVLQLIEQQAELLAERHGLAIRVVGAVDSRGGVVEKGGIAPSVLLEAKKVHGTVALTPGGMMGMTAGNILTGWEGPLTVLEASPVNLDDGGVGLGLIRWALEAGHSVVTANKGPLVLAFGELQALARAHGGGLAYSATVCGGLPIVNMGRYDLSHATVTYLEGVLNSTTQYILSAMEAGQSYDTALAHAQAVGIAETDPTLDVSGWDAANKLIILANAVLGVSTSKNDVTVEGIEAITPEAMAAQGAKGWVVRLIARAERKVEGGYALSVAPRWVQQSHPLAQLRGHQMGVWVETDINGTIFMTIIEESPEPTAAAMLRDVVLLARGARAW